MNKLIRLVLEEDIKLEESNEMFDYNFSLNSSMDEFNIEFKKFLGIYNSFFYYNTRLVFIWNNYEICLQLNDIKQIIELYLYSKQNKLESEEAILAEFIFTYYKTICSDGYKKENPKHNEVENNFWNALEEKSLKKEFFKDFLNECYLFYSKVIDYAFRNDIFITEEIINKIFNNLKSNQEWIEILIKKFISNRKNLYIIIDYDKKTNEHIKEYLEYIHQSLDEFTGFNYAKEMIEKLDKKGSLNVSDIKAIINKYIGITNKLGNKLQDKDYSFHNGIDELERLKNELNYLLLKVNSLDENQKNKIHECLNALLGLKRYLLSDNDYVTSEMIKRDYSQLIDSKEIEKMRKSLLNNNFLLYSMSKIDFIKELGIALDSYSKYALCSIAQRMRINSERQMYYINVEERKILDDSFKIYFDNLGKEYTLLNKEKLVNKLGKDYYVELLKYLSNAFLMHQGLIMGLFTEKEIKEIYRNLSISLGYDFENEYVILVSNILAIEANILELIKRNKLKKHTKEEDNIYELFEFYKDNKDCVNGLMYINYILYEKSGLNLRNDAVHGNLINKNLNVELLVSFSALIFISWLLNENNT